MQDRETGAVRANSLLGTPQPDRTETCQEHGEYLSRNVFGRVWTKCPKCDEDAKAKAEQAQAARDKQDRQARWEKKIGQSGIPLRFRDRTLPRFQVENDGQAYALKFAEAFAEGFAGGNVPSRCAVFVGKPGTGKTHLACGIALRIMALYGASALFTSVERMARRIREAKSFGAAETETEAIAVHVFPDLLILDEVGMQSGTDAEARALFSVVNERYEQRKPTIFLSNFDLDQVRACLDERVFDRLREDGGQVISFDWDSMRGREAA